ncbi:Vomp family autotransporter [Bartonella florencae]|uniref:Vomp family autotransporter n=1 Tax=Bartonella florencae TaxID=928210 RepID=UPI0002F64DD5|nr:Vomp family autotransporter [Bartonella florencae]
MKKKYSTPNLIKAVSLSAAMATLLSSVSPVFAANLAIVGGSSQSTPGTGVSYAHGSHGSVVFAGDDDYCGADNIIGRGGKQQQSIADNKRITAQEQYNRFINGYKAPNGGDPYGMNTNNTKITWSGDGNLSGNNSYMGKASTNGSVNALPEAYGVYSFATGCGSAATGNYSTAFGAGATAKTGGSQAFGVSALASGKATVAIGIGSEASGESSVAFGGLTTASGKESIALGFRTKASEQYAIAIGARAEAKASGAIAIGGSEPVEDGGQERYVQADAKDAIAIGSFAHAAKEDSVAIGSNAQVRVVDGVAIGGGSVSERAARSKGYDPATGKSTTETDDRAWVSNSGGVSVGSDGLTRQITSVAAGTEDTDAVNVAQLKALRSIVGEGGGGAWKLSANDTDPTDVNSGNIVDFSVKNSEVGKDNLTIEKHNENKKHKMQFALSDNLKLTSVTTNRSSMSDDGFIFKDGAKITVDGIDAGNKAITSVADATEDDDAVNYKQLKDVKTLAEKGWKLSVDGNNATDVKAGSTVDLVAGADDNDNKNIKIVKSDDNKVTFTLADDINVTSVTAGESVMDAAGFRFTDGDGPSITVKGINAGDKTIKGVAAGEGDTDAVNYKQLKDFTAGMETGWKLSVDGNNATDVKAGSTVNLVAGENKGGDKNITIVKSDDNGNKVTFTLNDKLKLTSVTAGNSFIDSDGFKFIDGNGPSITVNGINAGDKKIAKVKAGTDDTDAVNYKQLKEIQTLAEKGWQLSVDGSNATDVTAGSTVDLVAGENEDGSKNIKIVKSDGNKVTFTLNDDLKLTSVTTKNSMMSDEGFTFVDGGPSITVKGIDADDKKITKVKAGTDDTDAVNYKQLQEFTAGIETGWKLSVNGDDATNVKAGSTVDLVAGADDNGNKNIKIVKNDSNSNTVEFGLADDINVMSVTAGESIMSAAGFMFTDGDGPSITVKGINAGDKTIKGVAAGEGDTDAVNYKQLKEFTAGIETGWKLSVNGGNATNVKAGSTVDLIAVKHDEEGELTNIKIVRGDNNEIKFDLEEHIKVGSIDVGGKTSLTANGLTIKNGGPRITSGGIHAANKTITGVADGVLENDAVNFSQLKKVKDQISNVTENNLVKWDEGKKLITIGKEKGGTKIDITGTDGERTIAGVKDGDISKNSKEAINGSQINKISGDIAKFFGGGTEFNNGVFTRPRYNLTTIDANSEVTQKEYNNVGDALSGLDTNIRNVNHHFINAINDVAKYFGGGAGYDENKEWHAPVFKVYTVNANGSVSEQPYDNVASAFEGVNNTFTNIHNQISDITKNSLVKQEEEYSLITIGKETGGTKISIANKDGKERTLSDVKDGSISENSHDAINGSQINKISQDIADYFGGGAKLINGAIKELKYTLSTIVDGEEGKADFINVGAALKGLDKNVLDVNKRLKNVSNEFNQKIEGISKDALLWDDEEEAFVARHEKDGQKTNSKLKYLLDGDIAKGSTDAITGNQLYLMSNQLANYFGGGAKYENGKWIAPSFKIVQVDANGKTVENNYNTVADAFGGINSGMSNINDRIDDVINKVDSDALKWNKDKGAYDASHDGKPSKIINVADGRIAEDSKDAVNGGQLWQTNERVSKVENHITDVEKHVDNIDNKVNGLVDGVVLYDRDANGKKTNKVTLAGGDPSEPVLIDNVADGKIEKGSKEAVNGGQLRNYTQEQMKIVLNESKQYTDQKIHNITIDAIDEAVDKSKQYTDVKFDALNYSIEGVRKEARQAAAIGLAVSNLRYNDTPGKLSIGFGTGLWRSQSAFAFGAGYTSEKGNIRSNVSVTTSGGHWGVGAGFNMTLN